MSRGRIPADTDFLTFLRTEKQFKLHLRGFYASKLKSYLDVFPRENLLLLIYEEIKKDNLWAIRTCFEFLEVDSQFVSNTLEKRTNKGIDVCIFNNQLWGLRRAMKKSLPFRIDRFLAAIGRPIFDFLPKSQHYRSLDEELRQELLSEFREDISQLEDILERDLSVWYRPTIQQT